MITFVDTSSVYAVLCADDLNHEKSKPILLRLLKDRETLVCTNYILVETFALIQNRLGLVAARAFQEDVIPFLTIEWIEAGQHQAAVSSLLTSGRLQLSLVDCASFETMRRLGITTVFAFDQHFKEQGFTCIP